MIKNLFTYNENGLATAHQSAEITINGIKGNRSRHRWRQVLILPESTLRSFKLNTTDLKENILIDSDLDIHALPSGTAIRIGDAEIRLTFHCEPCNKIKHLIRPDALRHHRGYLGQVIHAGDIHTGDEVSVLDKRFETIPYTPADRIKWFLERQTQPILAANLVDAIGLPKSYCRALPALLRRNPAIDSSKVIYASARKPRPD